MTPGRWLVVSVDLPARADGEWAAHTLVDLGATAVEERVGTLVTHLPPPADDAAAEREVSRIRRALASLPGMDGMEVGWSWQPHEEWAETWRRGLAPRRVGERFLVTPTWMAADAERNELVIRLDPGVAFGTAGHATTRLCMVLLERFLAPGDAVVDAGTGTGILAIAAALIGAVRVAAVESDPMACEAARENLALNHVSGEVRIVHEELDSGRLAALGPVQGIVANIQTGLLHSLLPGAREALEPGGWLILGGVLGSEAAEVTAAATDLGFLLVEERTEDEWWSGGLRLAPTGLPRATYRS